MLILRMIVLLLTMVDWVTLYSLALLAVVGHTTALVVVMWMGARVQDNPFRSMWSRSRWDLR